MPDYVRTTAFFAAAYLVAVSLSGFGLALHHPAGEAHHALFGGVIQAWLLLGTGLLGLVAFRVLATPQPSLPLKLTTGLLVTMNFILAIAALDQIIRTLAMLPPGSRGSGIPFFAAYLVVLASVAVVAILMPPPNGLKNLPQKTPRSQITG